MEPMDALVLIKRGSHSVQWAQRLTVWLVALALLAGVGWFSVRLAGVRIYQADEAQNIYAARVLSSGQTRTAYCDPSPFIALISWFTRSGTDGVDLFVRARFLMLELFWLNLALIALATGESLTSSRGLIALLAAVTLAPLWDYGFEVRQENLLLTGMLLTWCALRVRPGGLQSYAIAGAIAPAMVLITLKACVYFLPISLLCLVCPPPGHQAPRWKLGLAWAASAVTVCGCMLLIYSMTGSRDAVMNHLHHVLSAAWRGERLWPGQTLSRLFGQVPLLLALVAAALWSLAGDVWRRGTAAFTWDSCLPEGMLVVVASAALVVNPAPNLSDSLLLVAFGFILAFRYSARILNQLPAWSVPFSAVAAILIFAHLVPFGSATSRHWSWTNFHQEKLMRLAEQLTDPARDPVYDGVGLVPTRPSIDFQWCLDSLTVARYLQGRDPKPAELLAKRPAAVIIPNYRTDWLPELDHKFIRSRYVPLADDFWVLGNILPAGGGTFEIFHAGHYRISTLKGSDLADTYPLGLQGVLSPEDPGTISGTLDGVPLSNKPVLLSAGVHRIESAADVQPAVVWMGPRLDRIHRIGPGDHRLLFCDWY